MIFGVLIIPWCVERENGSSFKENTESERKGHSLYVHCVAPPLDEYCWTEDVRQIEKFDFWSM